MNNSKEELEWFYVKIFMKGRVDFIGIDMTKKELTLLKDMKRSAKHKIFTTTHESSTRILVDVDEIIVIMEVRDHGEE